MRFVQVILTDEQADLLAKAAVIAEQNSAPADWGLEPDVDDESKARDIEANLQRLAVFFAEVAGEPTRFPVTGRQAIVTTKLARRLRREMKGEAQPASRSKRKAKRSQGRQKRDRAARRAAVVSFNEARERYEADLEALRIAGEENEATLKSLMSQEMLSHRDLVELFGRLNAQPLAERAVELRKEREEKEANPQAAIDAAAQRAQNELVEVPELD